MLPSQQMTNILMTSNIVTLRFIYPTARIMLLPVKSSAPAIIIRLRATLKNIAMTSLAYGSPWSCPPRVNEISTPNPMYIPPSSDIIIYPPGFSLRSLTLASAPFEIAEISSLYMCRPPITLFLST